MPTEAPTPDRQGRHRTAPGRVRRHRRSVAGVALLSAAALLAGCVSVSTTSQDTATPAVEVPEDPPGAVLAAASQHSPFVVHRTDTCGCCGAYEEILEAHGVAVEASVHEDVSHVRRAFGVPEDQASCHTGQIAGYAVEGHVPLEAIDRLLTERPEVDGIALAGMPAGSPGMPGPRQGPLVVTLIDGGEVVGELGRY